MCFDMSKVECYHCHRKGHFAREYRSPKDTRRNVAADSQKRNVLVKTSTSNALVSQCDGVGSYDWSFQAEDEPTNYALMAFTSLSSSSSNNEVVSCSKACTEAYATLQSHYDKLTVDFRKSQFNVISYKTGLEYVEVKLLVYQQNIVFEEDIKLLKLKVQLKDNALIVIRQKFEKAEQERDYLKNKLENFMFDCDEMFTSESDESLPPSPTYDRYQSGDGYHVVPLPYIRTFMPPKPDLVFHDAPNVHETIHTAFNVELSPTKPDNDLSNTHRPSTPIIKDWVSDSEDDFKAELIHNSPSFVQPPEQVKTPRPSVKSVKTSIQASYHETTIPKPKSHGNSRNRKACFVLLTKSKLVPITTTRPVTAVVLKPRVTRPRPVKSIVTKPHSPPRRHINRSPSPKGNNFPLKVTVVKVPHVNVVMGNPQHALKDKGVIDSRWSRHMIGNMSYLSAFEEINGEYVSFGGNPKGGKISGKGKIMTGKLDFDDVYFAKELKFNLFSVSQMCHKKNNVLFTDTECIVLSPEFKLLDENQVLLRVPREKNMYNVDLKNIVPSGDLTCLFANETLDEYNLWHKRLGHINFKTMNKFVKGSGHIWLFDIDTLTQTMNYQPVTAGNQSNPSAGNIDGDAAFVVKEPEFEERMPDTNTFSAAGPLNAAVSPTLENYSYVDTSQYPDDPNMPELEDITCSDNEEDVGAEADFTNLETTITVSPIPTTRVHKDHSVTQIIGDLSSATQTRSMTRVAKDQNGLSQINNDDFHTCMFACFLLQEEPKRLISKRKKRYRYQMVFRNKKYERGIVVRNKARLVTQGHTHEEGIDYEEVFALVARIEAIRLFLAYASFMGFMVYQMDVKSAFLYETIKEEVYVCQPLGFEDLDYLDKVYKVVKALYGLHQDPKAWYETLANYLLENGFQRGKIDQTLFIKRKKKQDGIFISQDKYVAEILRKFGLTDEKSASTPIDTEKLLLKDPDGAASVAVDDVPAAADEPSIPSPTPTTPPPPPSQDLPFTSQILHTPSPSLIAQPPSPQQQPQPS
nr:hypothetical protein [Tanacetum cinerariifolium]